jgi:hypothetical protein
MVFSEKLMALVNAEIEKGALSTRAADVVAKLHEQHNACELRVRELLEENEKLQEQVERDRFRVCEASGTSS